MANHSCEPNAVVVFPRGQGMGQMVAIRPIQPNEEVRQLPYPLTVPWAVAANAQILVCYIDVASPFSQRQSELSSRYDFTCDCSLCQREQDASWVDPRWCLLHPGCKLSGKGRMIDSIKWDTVPSDLRPGMASGVSQSKSSASSAIRCSACGETYEVRERLLMTALSRAKSFLRSDEDGWLLIRELIGPRFGFVGPTQADSSRQRRHCANHSVDHDRRFPTPHSLPALQLSPHSATPPPYSSAHFRPALIPPLTCCTFTPPHPRH